VSKQTPPSGAVDDHAALGRDYGIFRVGMTAPGVLHNYENTLSEFPVSVVLYDPRGLPAGPVITAPLSENLEP
jgi:hypothetical protein